MNTLIYGSPEYQNLKKESLTEFGVVPTEHFIVKNAIRERINYLKAFLKDTALKGFVLGISGGVDSSTVGRLCQIACEEIRADGGEAYFIAMRLPAGIQLDEEDAQSAIKFINADKTLTVNIGEAANILNTAGITEFETLENRKLTDSQKDFNKGNMKARLRMLSQYHVAGMYNAAVIGTDHNTEGVCGFWTKWGFDS